MREKDLKKWKLDNYMEREKKVKLIESRFLKSSCAVFLKEPNLRPKIILKVSFGFQMWKKFIFSKRTSNIRFFCVTKALCEFLIKVLGHLEIFYSRCRHQRYLRRFILNFSWKIFALKSCRKTFWHHSIKLLMD